MLIRAPSLGILWLFLVAGACGDSGGGGNAMVDAGVDGDVPSVCDGFSCGDHGQCEVAGGMPVCHCVLGFDATGDGCIYPGEDLCASAPCTDGCAVDGKNGPRCQCASGERSAGLACAPQDTPPCAAVACSGHGICEEEGGNAECRCDAGYEPSPDGLGCLRVWAPEEQCVTAVDSSCVADRGYETCCTGMNCEYRFEGGATYRGYGSAAEYCLGTDLEEGEDGICGGKPMRCDDLGITDEETCLAIPGCYFSPPTETTDALCWGDSVARNCPANRTQAGCSAMPGCNWIDAAGDSDTHCGPVLGHCVAGRAYQLCCDNACEARFEDGATLRGQEAIVGYCEGQLDAPVEDGSCLHNCSQFNDADSCSDAGCEWAGNHCTGLDFACFTAFEPSSCDARPSCHWQKGDSWDGLGETMATAYMPGYISLPVLSSPPFPPGTACPEECVSCVYASAAWVVAENGDLKPLPNMSFCQPAEAPVLAVGAGTVIRAQNNDGNHSVHIQSAENPNFAYIYDHLGVHSVSEGDVVAAGDPIGGAAAGETAVGYGLQVNEIRAPRLHSVESPCPLRYATPEVITAISAKMVAPHSRYTQDAAAFASWGPCHLPFVQTY